MAHDTTGGSKMKRFFNWLKNRKLDLLSSPDPYACPDCGKAPSFDEYDGGYCDRCGWEAYSEYLDGDPDPDAPSMCEHGYYYDCPKCDDPQHFLASHGFDDVSAYTMDADEIASRGLEHYERSR
jgi:Zn finger protein HypA/HybF involved in hydrogenase expression